MTTRDIPRRRKSIHWLLFLRPGWRGAFLIALGGLIIGGTGDSGAQQPAMLPASSGDALPPAVIAGLDMRPSAPLEFSRAWLAKSDDVRRRRADLQALGRLDGVAPADLARLGAALTGELRIPVIAVRYADVPEPFPAAVLAERLFAPARGDTLSLSDYWREVSGGLLRVHGQVTSWVPLRRPARHYLSRGEHGWGRIGRIAEFRRDVLEMADAAIDFSEFDNDGPDGIPNSGDDDGYVDFVAFFYAAPCGGDGREGAIWPHRGAMPPFETSDRAAGGGRIMISDYVILPARDPRTCGPAHVGVLAHETAHAFGLPDLYDYDGSSRGIGSWGLMGTGGHSSAHSPAHPGAWVKEQLGWVQVDWLPLDSVAMVPPVQRSGRIFRHDVEDGTGRYLLLENRAAHGSDRDLPGHGLLAWAVDPERGELGAWNVDERRPAVALLGADASGGLVTVGGDDSSGPFPGRTDRAAHAGLPLRVAVSTEDGAIRAQLIGDARRVPAPPRPAPGLEASTANFTGGAAVHVSAAHRVATTLAEDLPWGWGLSVSATGDVVYASYGWDAFGLRPRPRLLRLPTGELFPRTLSRLPADALYAPASGPDGETYVIAHARGRNYVYRVEADGAASMLAADVGREPAYGLARLADGTLLLASWSGTVFRIQPDGRVHEWMALERPVYQITADGEDGYFAALLSGEVLHVSSTGQTRALMTGFERGRLVTVASTRDGRAFAAERGGGSRIVELTDGGPRVLGHIPGGEFYGLTVDGGFLYVLDLGHRRVVRLPMPADIRRLAGGLTPPGGHATPAPLPR